MFVYNQLTLIGITRARLVEKNSWAARCVRIEEVVRKYRGEGKQEQQRGGEWKALCGTEN